MRPERSRRELATLLAAVVAQALPELPRRDAELPATNLERQEVRHDDEAEDLAPYAAPASMPRSRTNDMRPQVAAPHSISKLTPGLTPTDPKLTPELAPSRPQADP